MMRFVKYGAVAAMLVGFFVVVAGAPAAVRNGSATFTDPVGDAANAPDISSITVSDEAGVLIVHAVVQNRTGLQWPDQAAVFLNVDGNAPTGAPQFGGADVLLELVGDGSFWQRRWNGTTFPREPVPSPSYRAGWVDGYRFSIGLSELGMPKKVFFFVKTVYAPAGRIEEDNAIGLYNLETGSGEVPFVEVEPPNAPTGVRATRMLRTGVRITWASVEEAVEYEVWRARSRAGRGARIGTTAKTTFLDRRAARGTWYFYWVKALNDGGESSPSRRVLGTRR